MSTPGAFETGFNKLITFTKAFAITQIILWHFEDVRYAKGLIPKQTFTEAMAKLSLLDYTGIVTGLLSMLALVGHLATPLFFIMSGYGLYLSHLGRPAPWRVFFIKRAIRILPLYYIFLLAVYMLKRGHGIISAESLIYHALLLQTFTPHYLDFAALWFVGVLVWFYIAFPLFVRMFSAQWSRWALLVAALMAGPLVTWITRALGYNPDWRPPTDYVQFFVIGMLLAEAVRRGMRPLQTIFSAAGGALAFAMLTLLLYMQNKGLVTQHLTVECCLFFVSMSLPFALVQRSMALSRLSSFVAYASFVVFLVNFDFIAYGMLILKRMGLVDYMMLVDNVTYYRSETQLALIIPIAIIAIWTISYAIQSLYDRFVVRRFEHLIR